jgi:predicted Rossmann fold nucleotide-binding protein DprA/Smf involved in DNA uptake
MPDRKQRRFSKLVKQPPLQIDDVIEAAGVSSAQVSEILLDLELKGMLRQLPGKGLLYTSGS